MYKHYLTVVISVLLLATVACEGPEGPAGLNGESPTTEAIAAELASNPDFRNSIIQVLIRDGSIRGYDGISPLPNEVAEELNTEEFRNDLASRIVSMHLEDINTIQRSFFSSLSDLDNGILPDRVLAINKQEDTTAIKITYQDVFRGKNEGSSVNAQCGCSWEILFNGQQCSDPGRLIHLSSGPGGQGVPSINLHISSTVTGYCREVGSNVIENGPTTITVQVFTEDFCDCFTGAGDITGFLEAEEYLLD